jgi:predicted MFS family arabinose efflux permease
MRALVLSGMVLIAATYGLARFGYGLFLPQFTDAFQLDRAMSGFIQAGSFLAYCVTAALASRMSTRPRMVVVLAGAAATLGSLGVALSPTVHVFAASILIAGSGAGFATPGLVSLIERNVDGARQETAQTVVNSGTGLGIAAAGVLMLLTIGQWRLGWVAIAILAALATTATLRGDKAEPAQQHSGPRQQIRFGDFAPLVRPLVAAALAGASSAAVWTFGRSVLASSRPNDELYSILAWMTLGAAGVLGATAGRIVQAWSLRVAWTLTSMAMAAATTALGLASHEPVVGLTSVALFGASYTALSGVLIVWAVRAIPDRAAEGTVALFIALAVGQAAGSAALGTLLGVASPALAFTCAGALGILAVLPALSGSNAIRLAQAPG